MTGMSWSAISTWRRMRNDVWSHKQLLKVVSHTPIECEKLLAAQGARRMDRRRPRAHSAVGKRSTTWWSLSRPRTGRWRIAAAGLDHIWVSARPERVRQRFQDHAGRARGLGGGRPNHVPVTVTLEV